MTTPERREHERYTLSRLATIAGPGEAAPQLCVVRDVSLTGALIEAAAVDGVPAIFRLAVAGVSAARFCLVIRRTLDMLAVSFIDAPAARPAIAMSSTLNSVAGALRMPGPPTP